MELGAESVKGKVPRRERVEKNVDYNEIFRGLRSMVHVPSVVSAWFQ